MSRKMIDYKVEDGKIVSIDGYEVGGGGYKIQKLTITKNGLYDSEFEAYKPVIVDVPQISEDGTLLRTLLDTTKSTYYLFKDYDGTNVDGAISYIDTSSVTNMSYMFYNCTKLTSIPNLATSNVTNMENMFQYCYKLTSIPQFDTSNVRSMYNMFNYCNSLTSIGMYGFTCSVDITPTALEHDAIVALLNQAGTANTSSGVVPRITMGSAKLALLSDEEKAIATSKNFTLA